MTDRAIDPAVIEQLRHLNQEGEPDVVEEVLTLFLRDAPVRIAAISDAVDRRDGGALQRSAHTLKGAAASIGASRLQTCCRDLETLGKSGQFDGASGLLGRLRDEFGRVKTEAEGMIKRSLP